MAQKVTVALEEDLTGGPAEQTVRFAFEGTDYKIDLNAKNAAAFGQQLAPYTEHARKAGRVPSHRPGRTAAGRQRSGDIRAWAKERGLAVSERGRIPASVVEQYHAASGREHKPPPPRGTRIRAAPGRAGVGAGTAQIARGTHHRVSVQGRTMSPGRRQNPCVRYARLERTLIRPGRIECKPKLDG
jgi:hypothetical protein